LGIIILVALIAFEMFNYSTTDYALRDLLGSLEFAGIPWATILAVAFCGIDFAGVARIFTPQTGADEPKQVWYLFAAWMLAATMNAVLTWWGVSMAIANHNVVSRAVVGAEALNTVVPIFVAVMVWLIRVLIIGTFSVAGDRLFSAPGRVYAEGVRSGAVRTLGGRAPAPMPLQASSNSRSAIAQGATFRPAPKAQGQPESGYSRPEPTYHSVTPVSASAANHANTQQVRR
jgi:hypothetical protein